MNTDLRLPKVPSYVKNVVKSFKYAAENKVKALAPTTAEFATTNSELYKSSLKVIRDYKTSLKTIGKLVEGSSIYDSANNIVKNALDDLKTGNLINKARENSVMDDVFGGGDGDFDIDSGFDNLFDDSDSSGDSPDMQGFENVAKVSVKNASHISDTIKSSTGAIVTSVVQNQRDIANHQFMISQAHFQETMGRMEGINNTLVDVGNLIKNQLDNLINPSLQFYSDAMNKLDEISGYAKELASYQKNLYDARNKELTAREFKEDPMDSMFGAQGSLDISRYARVVMNNVQKEFNDQSMGMFDMFGGPSGFFKMLSASPLAFIPNTLVTIMVSTTFTKAIDRFDKSLSGFFSSMVSKFTEWQSSDSPLLKMLGKFLGVKAKADESINLGDYNVELGSLDKMTHRTINTVIPTYLRQIVDLLGGKAKIFDHTSGTFANLDDVRKNYNRSLENATLSGISDFTESINKRIDILLENVRDAKQVSRAKSDARAIMSKMVSSGHMYTNFKDMNFDDFERVMGSMNLQGGEQSFKIFASLFNSLPKEEQLKFAGAINESRMSKRRIQQSMIRDMYSKGYQSLFDGSADGKYNTAADGTVQLSPIAQGLQDKFVHNAVDYLRDIKGILLRGIKVFTMKAGRDNSTIAAIDNDLKKFRRERTTSQARTESARQRESKENERRNKEIDRRLQRQGGVAYDDISDLRINRGTGDYINERIKAQEELDRKAAEEGSIMYQMFGDTLIYTQVKNVKKKFEDLAAKPFSLFTNILNKASDMMHKMIFGEDPNTEKGEGLLKSIKKKFDEYWRKISDWFGNKVFNPIRDFFNGTDEKEGLFTKINKNIFTPIMTGVSSLLGVDITDLDATTPEGKKAMLGRMQSKMGEYYKNWGLDKALKGAGIGGAAGLFLGSPIIGAVMGASAGILSKSESFQNFLFGKLDENGERMGGIISKDLGKQLKTNAGKLGFGAGIGALLSTGIASFIPGLGLLGSLFTPFGAIGGALTGLGLTIAGTSDKFKNWLLGDLDKDGKRTGGLLSKSISNNLGKTMLKSGIGGVTGSILGGKLGALLGAGMSFIPGLGFLGSVMGPAGAIGGALMGMGMGIASSTDTFQTMLFGEKNKDGIRDKGGIFDKQFRDKFKSLLPKAGLSMLAGGFTFGKLFSILGAGMSFIPGLGIFGSLMGPAGIIGGSLLGLGLSITSSGQEFKEKLLGKVKGKEGDKSVFDKMEDFIGKNILSPMKDWVSKTAISIKGFFEESISVPFKAALAPLRHEFQKMTESMKDLFKSAWESTTNAIGKIFEDHVGKPFGEVMEEKVLKPLKSWIGKLVGGIGKFFGGIISAPVKALTSISQGLYASHVREGVGDYGDELGSQRGEYERKVSMGDRFVGTIRKFMKTGSFSDSMKYGKEQVKGFGKGLGNYFSKKGKAAQDNYNKIKEGLGDAATAASISSLNLFSDAFGKFADFLGGFADRMNAGTDNTGGRKSSSSSSGPQTPEELQAEVIKAQAALYLGYTPSGHETISETIENAKKQVKEGKATPLLALGWNGKTTGQKGSSKNSSPVLGSKEGERKAYSKYANFPTEVLQRNAYSIIIDNMEAINKNTGKIKDEVSGQLNGVGDNINRIRKMLAQIFDDKGGNYDGNKQRKGFFSKLKDFITSPFKFIGKIVTTAITAPFKLLSKTLEGLVSTAVQGVKVVSTLATTAIKTAGSIINASMGLVSGALKGFGHLVAATGKVVGSGLEFLGKTAFQVGGVIRDTFIEGLKLAGSAAKMFGSAMLSVAGLTLDVLASTGKIAWKGIKGAGKLAWKGVKGILGFTLGGGWKKGLAQGLTGKSNEMKIVGGIIDNIKDISFFDKFTVKSGMNKSALRVVVDNFEDIRKPPKGKSAGESNNQQQSSSRRGRLSLGWNGVGGVKATQSSSSSSSGNSILSLPFFGGATTTGGDVTPNTIIPGIPMLGWNGVTSSTSPESAQGQPRTSLLPLALGWNGKSSSKKDTTSAVARLGMKETIKAKEQALVVTNNIEEMSTAIVEAKDKKLDALRVKIVEGKDEKGGLISTITNYLPKIGLALAGLPALLEFIKSFIPDIKQKELGDPKARAIKGAVSVVSKTKLGKRLLNMGADMVEDIAENPERITESRFGKFVSNTVKKVKNTGIGKSVGEFVEGQVENTKNLIDDIIDLTDSKQVMKVFTDTMTDFFVGIAEKIENVPIMKGTMKKIAGALRGIGPAFVKLLQKIPNFLPQLTSKLSAKGFVQMSGKALAGGMRMLAKKFFPVVAFLEGFTQSEVMNETGASTFVEKLIAGLTMALLDTIQAITLAGGVLSAGATWVITGILLTVQSFASYWMPQFTRLVLSQIDKIFDTKYTENFDKKRKDVEDAYNTFREKEVNKLLAEEFAKAQKSGYKGTETDFYNENIDSITSKVKSKADFIRDNYDTKEFSLIMPSTWKNASSALGDIAMKPFGMIKDAGGRAIDAVTGKISSVFTGIIDKVGAQITDLKNGTVDAFKAISEKVSTTFTNVKDSIVETFTAIPEKFKSVFESFKESLFEKFKAVINFKDTFIQAIEGSFKTMMEHPMSPFRIMNEIFKKIETFFFGSEDDPTLLGQVRNGITSFLPDWMKPTGRGTTTPDDRVNMTTQQINGTVKDDKNTNKKTLVKNPMPNYQIFSQSDSRWANLPFNTGTLEEKFSRGGCAPTVMATLLNTFAGKNTTPDKEAQAALQFAGAKGGIQLDYFKKYGEMNGLNMGDVMTFGGDFVLDENLDPKGKMTSTLQGAHTKKAIEHLRQNKPLIGLIEDGRAKHYMIATHMDDKGQIHLIDPSDGKKYSMAANKFFTAVKYGYLMDPNTKTTDYEGGFLKQLKDKGLNIGSAFIRAVTNLVTKGIFSYDDLSLDNIRSSSQYGDSSKVKGITGTSFTLKPTITQEEAIRKAKQMLGSAPLDDENIKTMKIGEMPDNFGAFKVGDETIVENGQVIQFPMSSVVGRTADGRPVFFLGTESGNEFGLRFNYKASPEQYAKIMSPFAKEAYKKTNLRPDLSMVQSGLETGWGSSMKGNIAFNLKYRPWQRSAPIIFGTREGANSEKYRIATFANFPSLADAWIDHQKLLGFNTYKGYLENQWSNPETALEYLKPFAGDAKYVEKLKDLYRKYGGSFQGILGLNSNTTQEDTKSPFTSADGEMAEQLTGRGRIGGLLNGLSVDRVAGDLINAASRPVSSQISRGISKINDFQGAAKTLIRSGGNIIDSLAFSREQIKDIKNDTMRNIAKTASNTVEKTINTVKEVPTKTIEAIGDKMSDSVNSSLKNMDIINSGQGNQIVGLLEKLVNSNLDLYKVIGKIAEIATSGNNTVKGGNTTIIAQGGNGGISPDSDAYAFFDKLKSLTMQQ